MTINVSKDVERAIDAAVQSGQFASVDEMIDKLVRDYEQRSRSMASQAKIGEATSDPILGLMRDDPELMDEIVADAYRNRREDKWREFEL